MLRIEEVAELRDEEKDAILEAILGMAFADSEMQPDELRVLRRYAAHFTDQDLESLIKEYEPNLERVGRKIAHSDIGPVGRAILVRSMALVAASSGDLDESELNFYLQCLRAFGISEARQEKIEREVSRFLYAELCTTTLHRDGVLETARETLDSTAKRLELDPKLVALIEKHAQIDYRLERE
ncbi:MAG: hypothetical protein ACYS22_07875 [Planctomycetota bacterium]|jgi:DnaJ-domain-containing protein 1